MNFYCRVNCSFLRRPVNTGYSTVTPPHRTLIPLSTDGLLPPVPVCGHHCSVRGGCDGAAARHRPNVAPLQQPLHAHEWRAGATQGIAGNCSGGFLAFY